MIQNYNLPFFYQKILALETPQITVQWWIAIALLSEIALACLIYLIVKVKRNHDKAI